ncbi:MAG: DUF3604 domain-containing protein [Alphaproteobacteria bacterium]|nr:DUF3604 domain-containing protein [Alphaproteobacteria bacterium]
MRSFVGRRLLGATLALGLGACLMAGPAVGEEPNPNRNAYYGDLHVHTQISLDSWIYRNPVDQAAALEFARGRTVETIAGPQHLRLPLDFVAITDHSESFAVYGYCVAHAEETKDVPGCINYRKKDYAIYLSAARGGGGVPRCEAGEEECRAIAREVWQAQKKLVEAANEPGVFTTFHGYEYSMQLPGPGHYHRNVIFRDDNTPADAYGATVLSDPLLLWRWLDQACTGDCRVLAIPHNTNNSWGLGFALHTRSGTPYTDDDIRLRARLEPLAEIFQIKGASECAIGLGTSDEECAFNQLYAKKCDGPGAVRCAAPLSFVREGLKLGLKVDKEKGVNPFKLGFIGGTDTHSGVAGLTDEDAYIGSVGFRDSTPERRIVVGPSPQASDSGAAGAEGGSEIWRNPGGLAGIWAKENTRYSLFAAMERRETFATSGPRLAVRFFAGYGFPAGMAGDPDGAAATGYELGVPMGGDLPAPKGAKAPDFYVWASRDPHDAPLQKLQIVKGWLDAGGEARERVYDIACSDGLAPDDAHRCPPNGADVDLEDCSVSADKGAEQLATLWRDPEFDAAQRAFYYVRVLQNPSCRWSTWDALRLKRQPSKMVEPTYQERAWSSPIWYTPS